MSKHEYDSLGEDFEKKEHPLFGEEVFEKMVDRVAGIEKQLEIYDRNKFTPKFCRVVSTSFPTGRRAGLPDANAPAPARFPSHGRAPAQPSWERFSRFTTVVRSAPITTGTATSPWVSDLPTTV